MPYSLPQEPKGVDLRDSEGRTWEFDSFLGLWGSDEGFYAWGQLLDEYGPLSDVSRGDAANGYTPTTKEVRDRYAVEYVGLGEWAYNKQLEEEFDRWLAKQENDQPTTMRKLPTVAHKGPNETDAERFLAVADKIERGQLVGRNSREAVAALIRRDVRFSGGDINPRKQKQTKI